MTAAGAHVGPFELVASLGAGRFGEVWVARDRDGAEVVIKLAAATGRESLERELATLRKLADHPSIATPLAYDLTGDPAWIAFTRVPGRTLRDTLAADGPMLPVHALQRIRDILRALAAVHGSGVVHGDIKPDNVLVGDDGLARLLDFGVAAPVLPDLPPGKPPPEAVGPVAGSPAYLAPEVRVGALIRPAADVYAVGTVWFELLTGRLPRGPELPAAKNRHLPEWADVLYARSCCAIDRRWPDAAAMLVVVDAALTGQPPDPQPADNLPVPLAATARPIAPTPSGRLPIPAELGRVRLPEPATRPDTKPVGPPVPDAEPEADASEEPE